MSVPNKQIQLANDLMTLQKDYNSVVKRNLELRKEIDELLVAERKNHLMYQKEIERLNSALLLFARTESKRILDRTDGERDWTWGDD